jgi:sialate O-acetylesterase
MSKFPLPLVLGAFALALSLNPARAAVELPAAVGSHMVLQREKPVPIWGKADPGEEVTVTFNGQSAKAAAGADGKWSVKLAPMPAGGPYAMTIAGKNTLELSDILVGEVWFCGGQSNMAFMVENVTDGKAVVAAANHPNIRIFNSKRTIAETPRFTVKGAWQVCTPASVAQSPAVAYFFALKLQEDLGVPIGLLHSSWGGTAAEVWMPEELLAKEFPDIPASWAELQKSYPEAAQAVAALNEKQQEEFKAQAAAAQAEGKPAPKAPRKLTAKGEKNGRDTPSGGWNGMITPHVPYAVRGVIWYQGEANIGRAYQYRELFPALIGAWRQAWGEPELPFLFVQLPNMIRRLPPMPPDWPELREAQLMTALRVPHTGMAVAIDIGDPHDLHPTNKKPVGERLAHLAEGLVYGKATGDLTGPLYKSAEVAGDKVTISFTSADSGLVARDGAALQGFVIAGEDKRFVPAQAVIQGNTVVVSAPGVAKPVSVRYAWEDNPPSTLYNKAGFPASPFRTDDWPERTRNYTRILQAKVVTDAMKGLSSKEEAE